jgi:hypothetical protein
MLHQRLCTANWNRNVFHLLKSVANRSIAARVLALLLVFAQTFALFLVPIHRVAHAATQAVAVEQVSASTHGHSSFDWFGHEAGGSCDDWNAAFAHDFNPGSGLSYAPPVSADLPALLGQLAAPADSHLYLLSLARAPPRI